MTRKVSEWRYQRSRVDVARERLGLAWNHPDLIHQVWIESKRRYHAIQRMRAIALNAGLWDSSISLKPEMTFWRKAGQDAEKLLKELGRI